MHSKTRAKIVLITLAVVGVAGCSTFRTFEVKSQSAAGEIVVDGRAEDWRGAQFFIEEQQLLLGIKNDSRFLYIGIVAESRLTNMQILRQGLTVWFDPKGGKKKSWGIQYPLGLAQEETPFFPGPGEFEDEELEWPKEAFKELTIIRSKAVPPTKIDVGRAKEMGLEVSATAEAGLFTYELKVPLQAVEENGLAVGASPGQTIGLGFEAGEFKMRMPGGGMGRPPMGGSMGRGGGRMEGPAMGFGRPERLKIWAIVRLASGDRASDATTLHLTSFY